MEAHLAECPACAAELKSLRELSRILAESPLPEPTERLMDKLHGAIRGARDRGIVTLAERVIAVAAVVLIACVVWMCRSEPTAPENDLANVAWEMTAVASIESAVTDADQTLAQWIAADLSVENADD